MNDDKVVYLEKKEKESFLVTFTRENGPKIRSVHTSCGCAVPTYTETEIKVHVGGKELSPHLKSRGWQEFIFTVFVNYEEEINKDFLYIKVKVSV